MGHLADVLAMFTQYYIPDSGVVAVSSGVMRWTPSGVQSLMVGGKLPAFVPEGVDSDWMYTVLWSDLPSEDRSVT